MFAKKKSTQLWLVQLAISLKNFRRSQQTTLNRVSLLRWLVSWWWLITRLQAGRSRLQMSSWPGTVKPRWQTSSSSRVGVSKASAFLFVSGTVCSPYPTLNLRRPSCSSRRCTDLEQSSAACHICSVTSCLLLSPEDILLRTLLP